MTKVTKRQKEMLAFIVKFFADEDRIPSSRDIAWHFGFTQNSAICHMRALSRKGFIESNGRYWKFNRQWSDRPNEKTKRKNEGEDEDLSCSDSEGHGDSTLCSVREAGIKNHDGETSPIPPLRSKSL